MHEHGRHRDARADPGPGCTGRQHPHQGRFFRGRDAKLRPHFKTCKCSNIAHLQLAAGAKGITCAKVGEAEVLVNAGIRDILVANQVVDPRKIYRLACVAKAGAKITVAVDRAENIDTLSAVAGSVGATLHVLIEIDVGMNRCGVNTEAEALDLAERIGRADGLVFEGIQAYEGHLVYDTHQPELKITGLSEEHGRIADPRDELEYLQKIEYIPSHCCTTVNLHDQYYGVRKGRLEALWPISGRGKSR
jgi:3-hydroxy-D-aspartate aldolase